MNQFNCVILVSNFGEKKYFLISFPEFPQKKKTLLLKMTSWFYEVVNLPLLLVDRKELMRDSGIMQMISKNLVTNA